VTIDQIQGMNVAQVIAFYGTDLKTRERTFLMYRDDDGELREVSYAAFYDTSLRYAEMIQQIRAEQGKIDAARFHVAFFMQNTPEVVYLLGGCAFGNATLVGINNAQVGEKLFTDLSSMDIDVVFADEVEQPRCGSTFVESLVEVHQRYGLDNLYPGYVIARKRQAGNHPARIATIEERLAELTGNISTTIPLDEDSTGVIIFTSGTTGVPKGIEVMWKKLIDVGVGFTSLLNYTEKDVSYICMPLNHSNSLFINLMSALLNGARVLLRRRFSAGNFVRDLKEGRATVWNCVGDPVMYVLKTIGTDADYTGLPLRTVVSTGTNAANRAEFTRIFGLDIFAEAYGSTEVGAVAMVTPQTPDYSVGQVIPGRDVRIVDETTGRECELAVLDTDGSITNFKQSVGEILVNQASLGDSAFSGYYNQPDESAARIDKKGYYRMGDLGALEEKDGERYVIFLGRTGTDRLRTKGENFSTTFVEEIITQYVGVANSAVIGIPFVDSTENDNPIYVLEVQNPRNFNLDEFYAFCIKEIPGYAQPGFIRLIRELPRTATHKIRKPILMHDFIERNPEKDADQNDLIYRIDPDGIKEFKTGDYRSELARCTDPAVRARFAAATRRQNLFSDGGEVK
jgi:fatty-acyl-CoA synthase